MKQTEENKQFPVASGGHACYLFFFTMNLERTFTPPPAQLLLPSFFYHGHNIFFRCGFHTLTCFNDLTGGLHLGDSS